MVHPLVSRWVILEYFICHVSLDICVLKCHSDICRKLKHIGRILKCSTSKST